MINSSGYTYDDFWWLVETAEGLFESDRYIDSVIIGKTGDMLIGMLQQWKKIWGIQEIYMPATKIEIGYWIPRG